MASIIGLLFTLILPAISGYRGDGLRYMFALSFVASLPIIWKTNFPRELRATMTSQASNLGYWVAALPFAIAAGTGALGLTNMAIYSLAAWLAGTPIEW